VKAERAGASLSGQTRVRQLGLTTQNQARSGRVWWEGGERHPACAGSLVFLEPARAGGDRYEEVRHPGRTGLAHVPQGL